MTKYSPNIQANTEFLEARSRDLAEQEVERARGLDNKATALLAVIVALVAAAVAFGTQVSGTSTGEGARLLWAVEVVLAVGLLLSAGGFAVAAVIPRAVRTAVHITEVRKWRSRPYLSQDPTVVRGILLNASVDSVGHSRRVNAVKAARLKWASVFFAAALGCIVALAISLAFHHGSRTSANSAAGPRAVPGARSR